MGEQNKQDLCRLARPPKATRRFALQYALAAPLNAVMISGPTPTVGPASSMLSTVLPGRMFLRV